MQKCVVSCALIDAEGMFAPDYKEPDVTAVVKCGPETYKTDRFSGVNPKWMSHFTIGMKSTITTAQQLEIAVLHQNSAKLGSATISLEALFGEVAQKIQLPLRGGTLEKNGDVG